MNEGNHYTIDSAAFSFSVHNIIQLPSPLVPEVAFVGRSNVGKSSLLNAICNTKSLARVSKTPGRTQALNFFEVIFSQKIQQPDDTTAATTGFQEKHHAYLVDLPGYGYAQVSKARQQQWLSLMETYLLNRENLRALFLLLDCRRDPKEEERWFVEHGSGGNLFIVLTKIDKLSKLDLKKQIQKISKELNLSPQTFFISGLLGKKKQGVEKIRSQLCSLLMNTR